jgi:ubiquinone/menaquinone biosynthesis C-methylase UbiE
MKYDYVNFFEDKLKILAKCRRVLDAGGGHPFQKYMAQYKDWFSNVRYETLDISNKYSPTILGDIHSIPLEEKSVDGVLCLSVLEHLHNPQLAVKEMNRILSDGGKLLAYTHFIYPYHARNGIYEDYYRFTETAVKDLFKDFSKIEIKKQGGYFRSMMFFLPFQSKLKVVVEPIAYMLDKLFRTEKHSTTAGFYIYCEK